MINRERLLATFIRLTEIDAESFHERKMADELKRELKALGICAFEDDAARKLQRVCAEETQAKETQANETQAKEAQTEGTQAEGTQTEGETAGNLWACLPGNLKSQSENRDRAILLCAHMDTVRPGRGKRAVIHGDGTVTSDGTTVLGADDAAGIAEILEVLSVIRENHLSHPDIELFFPAAEEPYCQGSRLFDFRKFHARSAYVLDMSGAVGTAAIAAPSIYALSVRVRGRSAHAGFCPGDGIHAIYIAARAIAGLPYGQVEKDTTVNFGTIHGGQGKNIVPEEVVLSGEIRSMADERAAYWIEKIRETFEKCAAQLGGSVDLQADKAFGAYRVGEGDDVVRTFKAAAKTMHLPVQLVETFGGSDNNHIQANGINGIVVANGMHDVHTLRERTHIDEMADCAGLILEMVCEN